MDHTFVIVEMLIHDNEDLANKGAGLMLRFAGDKNPEQLRALLDKYAATMPSTLLRYSLEHFDKEAREYYMLMGKRGKS